MESDKKIIDFITHNIQIKSITQTIINELNKTALKVEENCTEKINYFLSKLDGQKIKNLEKILLTISDINEVIQICIKSMEKIFQDGKISTSDMPLFIEMIVDIVKTIKEKDISEDIKNVVDLCEFICQVVIVCMNKMQETELFLKILSSSITLLKFELNPRKFLPCC